jgi:hypothetical protein
MLKIVKRSFIEVYLRSILFDSFREEIFYPPVISYLRWFPHFVSISMRFVRRGSFAHVA